MTEFEDLIEKLRSGKYDKVDIMDAWITMKVLDDDIEKLIDLAKVQHEALEGLLAYVETGYGDFESDEGAQAHEALAKYNEMMGDKK